MKPIPTIVLSGALLLTSCTSNEDPKNNQTPKGGPEKSQPETPSAGMVTVDLVLDRDP